MWSDFKTLDFKNVVFTFFFPSEKLYHCAKNVAQMLASFMHIEEVELPYA